MYKFLIQPIFVEGAGHHLYSLRSYSRKYCAIKLTPKFQSWIYRKIWLLIYLIKVRGSNHLVLDFTNTDILILKLVKSKFRSLNVTPFPNMSAKRLNYIRDCFMGGVRLISHTSSGVEFYKNLNITVENEPSPDLVLEDVIGQVMPCQGEYILCLARHVPTAKIVNYLGGLQINHNVVILGQDKQFTLINDLIFMGIVNDNFLQYLILNATKIIVLHPSDFWGESAFLKHVNALGRSSEFIKLKN